MAPARVAGGGGPSQSSSASGVFFQGDGQSPATGNSSGNGQSGLGPCSREMNCRALNSGTNSSGPSIGASSLVTDANSALSGRPRLQRSTSINNESCAQLPSSPMSFSSNVILGSSMVDGSSLKRQSQHQHQEQGLVQGASSAPLQSPMAQELDIPLHAQKKSRLDIMQPEDILQMLQRQETLQIQGRQNPQLQARIQQQRLSHQPQLQHMLQSLPQMQRIQLKPQLQQVRHSQLQHQAVQAALPMRRPSDCGICTRRLMQYMYHQRHRPPDNCIAYWRKFVLEYFAPRAKKRWCLASYGNAGNHASGVFPQAAKDSWQCGICGSKSGKGFEATFEVLPRLFQIEFDSGLTDEFLFLDMPREFWLPTGMMVLDYAKAVQESVYEQVRVVHEGQMRIIFMPDLKIVSWEFCARRHEEFLLRRLIVPQVNQLLQAAPIFQAAVSESGSTGASPQDLKSNLNMFVHAGRQLAKILDLRSLNDMGFSKRYMRCVQISEVVNSMKDLIDFSSEHNIGPIESLKKYSEQAAAKRQTNKTLEVDQLMTSQGQQGDHNTFNKIKVAHPGLSSQTNSYCAATGILNNTAQNAMALNNYQYLLRTSANQNQEVLQGDKLRTFVGPSQGRSMPLQGPVSSTLSGPSVSGSLNPQQQQQLQLHNSTMQSSQSNEQEHAIQQLLQEMMNNDSGVPQQAVCTPSVTGNMAAEAFGSGIGCAVGLATRTSAGPVRNGVSLGNNINYASNNVTGTINRTDSSRSTANNGINPGQVVPQNVCLPELDQDIISQVVNNGILNGEPRDVGKGWKM
ncbi:probable transcriptional regulator SLK3 [Elaeis guineensis]|uniref:Probable transcriptional regulator SLK3 n=2 Tax=Elaeis guineensis var. tenera TaxID=51953 RepID=A0A6I9R253_ELAGV|nr:probable transcriptional regulator SLK3 [Elaeis guineensis]XP_010919232.1 probable transcriptional regulator SLK3 [Elaeis guineensis]